MAVIVPELGCEMATLSIWHAREGERVEAGDRLVEMLIAGATIDVVAPASGQMVRLVPVGSAVAPGMVLGRIDPE